MSIQKTDGSNQRDIESSLPNIHTFVLEEVCNRDTLQSILINGKNVLDDQTRSGLKKYANRHFKCDKDSNGNTSVKVIYSSKTFEGKTIGRMYPIISNDGVRADDEKNRCMTFSNNMPKIVRDSLCLENYHDIDFKNSHPNIFYQTLQKNTIQCKDLKYYNENRDIVLHNTCEHYNVGRDIAKQLFIEILYGGSYISWKTEHHIISYDEYDFIVKFQKSVRAAADKLLQLARFSRYTRYSESLHKTNPFSAISHLLTTIENECLVSLQKHYLSLNYKIGSFEYDGLKIRRKDKNEFPKEYLISGQEYIKKTVGYSIELVEKPMEYCDMLKSDIKIYTITDQIDAANIILKNTQNILYSKQTKFVYYKNTEHTWAMLQNDNELNRIVVDFNLVLDTDIYRKFYNRFEPNITNISKGIINRIIYHPEKCVNSFENMIFSSTLGKTCYENGVYNYITKELIPWSDARTYNVYSTIIINSEYNPNVAQEDKDFIYNLMKEQFGDIFDEFFTLLARALAGYTIDKRWFTLFGNRNSGKGVFCDILTNAFGPDYIDITNSNNMIRKNGNTDSERDKGWILTLRYARLVISNEIDPSCTLNGVLIKEICSGGDIIRARPMYKDSIRFKHQFTYMICCNDIPKTDPIDANKTRVAIEMPFSYVSEQELLDADEDERQMLRPEIHDIKMILQDKKYLDAFTSIVFDHFMNSKPKLKLLKDMGDTFLDNPIDVNKEILKYFVFDKKNDKLFLSNPLFKKTCNEIRASLSITDTDKKIRILLKSKGAVEYRSYDRGLRFVNVRENDN
jgi:hypothetical protein